jgi:hypothetical protein
MQKPPGFPLDYRTPVLRTETLERDGQRVPRRGTKQLLLTLRRPATAVTSRAMTAQASARRGWLLLMHRLPPHPSHLRVKVWRRLARIGAVALKNSVYVLPRSDATLEDLQWIRREILDSRGEAVIVEAIFLAGMSDAEVDELFRKARDEEYDGLIKEARTLGRGRARKLSEDKRKELEGAVAKLEQRIEQIAARDFFGTPKREAAAELIREIRERTKDPSAKRSEPAPRYDAASVRGRAWVTRTGIKVDRIASAWLIRRFIDPDASFKFVPAKGYEPEAGELRFDMFDAEFSHEGDDCTFETLCRRFGLKESGLRAVAEIVHDIDVKDEKFNRPETAGIAMLIDGLVRVHGSDEARLERGSGIFDEILAHFS